MGVLFSPQDFAGRIGDAPPAGQVRVGEQTLAGADFLSIRPAQSAERLVMPHLGRSLVAAWFGTGASTVSTIGMPTPTVTGGTARGPNTTSMATRQKRTGFVSAATAAAFASCYSTTGFVTLGNGTGLGGFFYVVRFVIADAVTVSGARMFIGLSGTTAAPTNAEPSGLTNQIGAAQLSTSANLHIVFGGSTAQTAIDLGAGFPATGGSANLYELVLHSEPNDNSKVGYRVERLNTGDVAEGSLANAAPGTSLPATSTMLAMRGWRTNNATGLAVGYDLVSAVLIWDF